MKLSASCNCVYKHMCYTTKYSSQTDNLCTAIASFPQQTEGGYFCHVRNVIGRENLIRYGQTKLCIIRGATALLVAAMQPVATRTRWSRKLRVELIPINAHDT